MRLYGQLRQREETNGGADAATDHHLLPGTVIPLALRLHTSIQGHYKGFCVCVYACAYIARCLSLGIDVLDVRVQVRI